MDNIKADNEGELTSTMDNVTSVASTVEKNDTSSDATPTSSTDANICTSGSSVALDDPISSTTNSSSDNLNQSKQKMDKSDFASISDHQTSAYNEADLLDITNITNNEKITEDVEDLVHDLESLLGESTDSFNITSHTKLNKKDKQSSSDTASSEDVLQELQELTANVLPNEPPVEAERRAEENADGVPSAVESTEDTSVVDIPNDSVDDSFAALTEDNPIEPQGSEIALEKQETKFSEKTIDLLEETISNLTDIIQGPSSDNNEEVIQDKLCIQDQDISHSEPGAQTSTVCEISDIQNDDDLPNNEEVVTSSDGDPNETKQEIDDILEKQSEVDEKPEEASDIVEGVSDKLVHTFENDAESRLIIVKHNSDEEIKDVEKTSVMAQLASIDNSEGCVEKNEVQELNILENDQIALTSESSVVKKKEETNNHDVKCMEENNGNSVDNVSEEKICDENEQKSIIPNDGDTLSTNCTEIVPQINEIESPDDKIDLGRIINSETESGEMNDVVLEDLKTNLANSQNTAIEKEIINYSEVEKSKEDSEHSKQAEESSENSDVGINRKETKETEKMSVELIDVEENVCSTESPECTLKSDVVDDSLNVDINPVEKDVQNSLGGDSIAEIEETKVINSDDESEKNVKKVDDSKESSLTEGNMEPENTSKLENTDKDSIINDNKATLVSTNADFDDGLDKGRCISSVIDEEPDNTCKNSTSNQICESNETDLPTDEKISEDESVTTKNDDVENITLRESDPEKRQEETSSRPHKTENELKGTDEEHTAEKPNLPDERKENTESQTSIPSDESLVKEIQESVKQSTMEAAVVQQPEQTDEISDEEEVPTLSLEADDDNMDNSYVEKIRALVAENVNEVEETPDQPEEISERNDDVGEKKIEISQETKTSDVKDITTSSKILAEEGGDKITEFERVSPSNLDSELVKPSQKESPKIANFVEGGIVTLPEENSTEVLVIISKGESEREPLSNENLEELQEKGDVPLVEEISKEIDKSDKVDSSILKKKSDIASFEESKTVGLEYASKEKHSGIDVASSNEENAVPVGETFAEPENALSSIVANEAEIGTQSEPELTDKSSLELSENDTNVDVKKSLPNDESPEVMEVCSLGNDIEQALEDKYLETENLPVVDGEICPEPSEKTISVQSPKLNSEKVEDEPVNNREILECSGDKIDDVMEEKEPDAQLIQNEDISLAEQAENVPTVVAEDHFESLAEQTENVPTVVAEDHFESIIKASEEEIIQNTSNEPEEHPEVLEQDETALAVASLENIDMISNAPELTEEGKQEMEALRLSVENITETENDSVPQVNDEEQIQLLVSTAAENLCSDIEEVEKTADDKTEVTPIQIIENKSDEILIPEEDTANYKAEYVGSSNENEQIIETESHSGVQSLKIDDIKEVAETVLPDSSQSVSDNEVVDKMKDDRENRNKTMERSRRHKKGNESKTEELSINVDVPDKEKSYSPKITIKPIKVPDEEVSTTSMPDMEPGKGSLKMTITKQSDTMHSILKVCDDSSETQQTEQEEPLPKLKIKAKTNEPSVQKMSTRSSRQVQQAAYSTQRSSSPRITIKPVVKPETPLSPLKIKIGLKSDESTKKHSPKLNIKPLKEEEDRKEMNQSPRKVLIKPIVKPAEEEEQALKITIKSISKPDLDTKESVPTKFNIKPVKKSEEEETDNEKTSPKITIKPIVKPPEQDTHLDETEEDSKKRIVLKINKGNLPAKETRKREHPPVPSEDEKSEKLAKITVKFSKEGGHPHIVHQSEEVQQKRFHEESNHMEKSKKQKIDPESVVSTRSKQKDHVPETQSETKKNNPASPVTEVGEPAKHVQQTNLDNPGHGGRGKHKDSVSASTVDSKRMKIKESKQRDAENVAPKNTEVAAVSPSGAVGENPNVANAYHSPGSLEASMVASPNASFTSVSESETNTPSTPQPRKRGRPRKIKPESSQELVQEPVTPVQTLENPTGGISSTESGRPKRSCRGQSALDTLGLKPRKPRGSRGGRGGKAGETRAIPLKPQKEVKLSHARLKLMQKALSEAGTVSVGTGENKSVDIEDILPTSQVQKKHIDVIPSVQENPVEEWKDSSENPIKPEDVQLETNDEKYTKDTKKDDIEGSNIIEETANPVEEETESTSKDVPIDSELDNFDEIKTEEPKVETLEEPKLSPIDANVSGPEEIVLSDSASPSQEISEAMLTSEPATQDVSSPKVFNALDESMLLAPEPSSIVPSGISTTSGPSELVMMDEETRMSPETSSRAQTPAKQVIPMDIEESQSSVLSTATTESGKVSSSRASKAPRLEVQEPEGTVLSPDQLAEYYWNGQGPFMLQEQVAHFLGIKSFKRKYPGIKRRMLEMQERDFIRESGLVSEHMCDLGLTAVHSADILDIMYSDFQDKYEEYCKHQRDRQAKELINKQRALTLAASQEKNKADLTESAKQSAAQWNAAFNKTRREQRRACIDLQTYTIHYPKGKMRQISKGKPGNYPVSLVPGQFTDYYKEFTPTEINNFPLNTMCYDPIDYIRPEVSSDSSSDGSDSDSDSSSDSDSDSSSSSGIEDCRLCKHSPKKENLIESTN